jgi:hypothetical protein
VASRSAAPCYSSRRVIGFWGAEGPGKLGVSGDAVVAAVARLGGDLYIDMQALDLLPLTTGPIARPVGSQREQILLLAHL